MSLSSIIGEISTIEENIRSNKKLLNDYKSRLREINYVITIYRNVAGNISEYNGKINQINVQINYAIKGGNEEEIVDTLVSLKEKSYDEDYYSSYAISNLRTEISNIGLKIDEIKGKIRSLEINLSYARERYIRKLAEIENNKYQRGYYE
ncbi:hypothetical protein [Clostridium tertium]|uniref:Uncharacterized protein n=1 Tax=Clostridium tertium TaxID=1559 RepID=A0A6N3ACM0_9CLOT